MARVPFQEIGGGSSQSIAVRKDAQSKKDRPEGRARRTGSGGEENPVATYVLIHGAGGDSWYWHLVGPQLAARGHDVVAVDLPCDDDRAGLAEYADCVIDAAARRCRR